MSRTKASAAMKESKPEGVRALVIRSDIKLGGATGAKVIGCDDGHFYVCKSLRFLPEPQPHLLANEQISKNLADLLSLPVQPARIVNLRGERLFGSLLEAGLRDMKTVRLKRDRLANWPDMPAILVFDIFICNLDRHQGNSLALISGRTGARYQLRIMDHSHALMGSSLADSAVLQDEFGLAKYLNFYRLNTLIEEEVEFEPALASLERLTKEEISWAVGNLPEEWLPNYRENCPIITRALLRRKERVRELLARQLAEDRGLPPINRLFPNIQGLICLRPAIV